MIVSIVEWPKEIPEGYDISSVFEIKGPEAVKALIENAVEWESEKEVTETDELPPFPLETLPSGFADLIRETKDTNYLTDSAALWTLSMAGHAIGTKRSLKVSNTWTLLPNVSTICVAPSGTKKTPTLNLVAYPIRNHREETSKVILDTTLEALHFVFKESNAVVIIRDELKALFGAFNKFNQISINHQFRII